MAKFLIGVGTAALWFVLSYAAHAEPPCAYGSGTKTQNNQDNQLSVRLVSPLSSENAGTAMSKCSPLALIIP